MFGAEEHFYYFACWPSMSGHCKSAKTHVSSKPAERRCPGFKQPNYGCVAIYSDSVAIFGGDPDMHWRREAFRISVSGK